MMLIHKQRRIRRLLSYAVAFAVAFLAVTACAPQEPFEFSSKAPIEYKYSVVGPFGVAAYELGETAGDAGIRAYVPVGTDTPSPVVIWQNGTGVDIDTYVPIARHLASWGLVVIGSYDQQMASGGTGIEVLQGLPEWSRTSEHVLNGLLDLDAVSMVGSSQGAVGVINSHTRFAQGRQLRALAIHGLPTERAIEFFGLDFDYNVTGVTAPIFVMTGTEDDFISPIALNTAVFEQMKYSPLKVLGVSQDASHIELADDGGRMRGYLTAWLLSTLTGDAYASGAFVNGAEIKQNSSWITARVGNRN